MQKQFVRAISVLLLAGLTSCGFGKYNQAPSDDVNKGNKRIYGNAGGEPLQLKNQYPDPSVEEADRANKIREKFYPRQGEVAKSE